MYLLEIQEHGAIVYALESEGHGDGFSLNTFVSDLVNGWAGQYDSQDCLGLLSEMLIVRARYLGGYVSARAKPTDNGDDARAVRGPATSHPTSSTNYWWIYCNW
jgi:hypothetical protein